MRKIVLVGGGGHCKVIIDAIKKGKVFRIIGIVDKALPKEESVSGVPVVGNDDRLKQLHKQGVSFAFISVGSIGDSTIREKIYLNLLKIGFELPVIIHPSAVIGSDIEINQGTFVAAGAVINPGTKIGKNAIINTRSSIDHDCRIGDFTHIAPGAVVCGGVRIGSRTHVGAGANIVQYLSIGSNCMIAAGMTVCANVADKQRVLPNAQSRFYAKK